MLKHCQTCKRVRGVEHFEIYTYQGGHERRLRRCFDCVEKAKMEQSKKIKRYAPRTKSELAKIPNPFLKTRKEALFNPAFISSETV